MKKLCVVEEETTSHMSGLVSEFLSLQYNYGLYDFNVDKILFDLDSQYSIKHVSSNAPYYTLTDKNGGIIRLVFLEEYN
jgi:hypothetical protein